MALLFGINALAIKGWPLPSDDTFPQQLFDQVAEEIPNYRGKGIEELKLFRSVSAYSGYNIETQIDVEKFMKELRDTYTVYGSGSTEETKTPSEDFRKYVGYCSADPAQLLKICERLQALPYRRLNPKATEHLTNTGLLAQGVFDEIPKHEMRGYPDVLMVEINPDVLSQEIERIQQQQAAVFSSFDYHLRDNDNKLF